MINSVLKDLEAEIKKMSEDEKKTTKKTKNR